MFQEHDELLAEFIRYAKKIKNISIESVGFDKGKFELIFASKKYLNMMEKEFSAQKYIINRREGIIYINKIL